MDISPIGSYSRVADLWTDMNQAQIRIIKEVYYTRKERKWVCGDKVVSHTNLMNSDKSHGNSSEI